MSALNVSWFPEAAASNDTCEMLVDDELSTREVRDAHAVHMGLLIDIARRAREFEALGHTTYARALRSEAKFFRRRAMLHLRRLRKEAIGTAE